MKNKRFSDLDSDSKKTVLWKEFLLFQKDRILERLQRYNNVKTIKEQLAEGGDLSLYQKYKVSVVSKFLIEALNKISEEKYGICSHCGSDIPIKRLLLVPGALNCVACEKNMKGKQQ